MHPSEELNPPGQAPEFRVHALTIPCTDVDRSVHFYRTVLGASSIPTDNGIGWWFNLGRLNVTLMPTAAEPSPARFPTPAVPILWLEVDDLTKAEERFARFGVEVIERDELFIMVADPDGLVIEIWQSQISD